MRNEPRDVTGGRAVWGGMIPGLQFFDYLLGLFTVPIEAFLRRDFGERYFTWMNAIGGYIILVMFKLVGSLLNLINMLNPLAILTNRRGSSVEGAFSTVIEWYVYFCAAHFLTIWVRNITGKPVLSFSAGRSWLRFLGGGVMFVMNLVLDNVVRLIFEIVPGLDKSKVPGLLPVLKNKDRFTERFIEPFVVLVAFFVFMGAGQFMIAWWLFFSFMALNLYTGMRHQADRGEELDYQDQLIKIRNFRGGPTDGTGSAKKEKMMQEMAREVEKNPDVLPVIEQQNPSLARAIERISPKLKAIADQGDNPAEQLQAA